MDSFKRTQNETEAYLVQLVVHSGQGYACRSLHVREFAGTTLTFKQAVSFDALM